MKDLFSGAPQLFGGLDNELELVKHIPKKFSDGGCFKPEYESLSDEDKHKLSERIMDWQEVAFVQAWARVPPDEMDQ